MVALFSVQTTAVHKLTATPTSVHSRLSCLLSLISSLLPQNSAFVKGDLLTVSQVRWVLE